MNNYLSTGQLAKLLNVSRTAVLKKIKSGSVKAEKVGPNYIISKKEAEVALGLVVGEKGKKEIELVIKRGIKEYGSVIKKLGKE